MKKLLISLLITFTTFFSFAYANTENTQQNDVFSNTTIDISSLSPDQLKEIKDKYLSKEQLSSTINDVSNASESALNVVNKTIEKTKQIDYNKYYETGVSAGQAILGFTKQIGMATADLLTSWTGVFIILFAILYYFGVKICLFIFMIAWMYLSYKFINKLFSVEEEVIDKEIINNDGTKTVTYKTKKVLHFRHNKKHGDDVSDSTAAYFFSSLIFNIPTVVAALLIVFV